MEIYVVVGDCAVYLIDMKRYKGMLEAGKAFGSRKVALLIIHSARPSRIPACLKVVFGIVEGSVCTRRGVVSGSGIGYRQRSQHRAY